MKAIFLDSPREIASSYVLDACGVALGGDNYSEDLISTHQLSECMKVSSSGVNSQNLIDQLSGEHTSDVTIGYKVCMYENARNVCRTRLMRAKFTLMSEIQSMRGLESF